MPVSTKVRSRIYASIAGIGLSAVSYWLGTIHGASGALDQFRDLAFASTDSALRRALRLDALMAAPQPDAARRATMGAAVAQYDILEADAAGRSLPATTAMQTAIVDTRRAIAAYCATPAAAFHAGTTSDLCAAHLKSGGAVVDR